MQQRHKQRCRDRRQYPIGEPRPHIRRDPFGQDSEQDGNTELAKLLKKNKRQLRHVISLAYLKQHLADRIGNSKLHQAFFGAVALNGLVQIADR